MKCTIDKARKHVAVWSETAQRLKRLSRQTEETQVELLHEAVLDLEHKYAVKGEEHENESFAG